MRFFLAIVLTMQVAFATLRQAEALAENDRLEEANALYREVATSATPPREILVAAAIGLYRTGAWSDSAAAFARLGTFAKGEEDLRFYHAVVLFEIGRYDAAKRELACALPFIEETEEVSRSRAKIEAMAAAMK